MNETRKPQGTTPPTRRRADRRSAAVITEYIYELTTAVRPSPRLPAHTEGRSA